MAEFKIIHLVSRLLDELGVSNERESYLEKFGKKTGSFTHISKVNAYNIVNELAEKSPSAPLFKAKYKESDALLIFMKGVMDNPQLMKLLKIKNIESFESRIAKEGKEVVSSSSNGAGASSSSSSNMDRVSKIATEIAKLKSSMANIGITPGFSEQMTLTTPLRSSSNFSFDGDSFSSTHKRSNGGFHSIVSNPVFEEVLEESVLLTDKEESTTLRDVPLDVQEFFVVEDLLYVLLGIDGRFVRMNKKLSRYEFDPFMDASVRDMVSRILPLSNYYINVDVFIQSKSKFEFGLVFHALASAMRMFAKDFLVLIAQLEHRFHLGELTLQRFWYYIQPMMKTMKILNGIIENIGTSECRGGALLSLLYDNLSSRCGDEQSKRVSALLLEKSSKPYFSILKTWITKGIVEDQYSEFMIQEQRQYQKEDLVDDFNDTYWTQRFIIVPDQVPTFLESCQDEILLAGKCLHVIRECGVHLYHNDSPLKDLPFEYSTENEKGYISYIREAVKFANDELLDRLFKENQLTSHLQSLKKFFLIENGDFIVHFMDVANDELSKPVREVSITKIQSLLELTLRSGASVTDPNKDSVCGDTAMTSLFETLLQIISISADESSKAATPAADKKQKKLTGFDAFMLDFQVEFPLSLIISKKSITKYQLIFRHLFYLKYLERLLSQTWATGQSIKKFIRTKKDASIILFLQQTDILRHRMLSFVQNLEYYSYFEVIEPQWNLFDEKLKQQGDTVDKVLQYHSDLLDTCLKECMLTNPKLLQIFREMMKDCTEFCSLFESFIEDLLDDDGKSSDEYLSNLAKLSDSFGLSTKTLVESLNYFAAHDYEHHMANLVCRLDYNFYFSSGAAESRSEI